MTRTSRTWQSNNSARAQAVSSNVLNSQRNSTPAKRGLLTGGTLCFALGTVLIITPDTRGLLTLIAVVAIFFGVLQFAILCMIYNCSSKKQAVSESDRMAMRGRHRVHYHQHQQLIQPHSNHLSPHNLPSRTSSLSRNSPTHDIPPPSPLRTSSLLPSPVGNERSYSPVSVGATISQPSRYSTPIGLQLSDYPVSLHGQTSRNSPSARRHHSHSHLAVGDEISRNTSHISSPHSHSQIVYNERRTRNHSPINGQRSYSPSPLRGQRSRNISPVSPRRSYSPSFFGRRSRNHSPRTGQQPRHAATSRSQPIVFGDDPPPYRSVVSELPWQSPPSYQEVSSCLIPRANAEEPSSPPPSISITVTDGTPHPSGTGVSLATPEDSSGRSSPASNPTDS